VVHLGAVVRLGVIHLGLGSTSALLGVLSALVLKKKKSQTRTALPFSGAVTSFFLVSFVRVCV
jgi:hypothetical protein